MSHKAVPDIEKALDPVLVLYQEQQMYLNLWSVDILSIWDEHVNQPNSRLIDFQGSKSYCAYFKMNAKLDRKPM